MTTPWSWTSGLQNCERIHFCCSKALSVLHFVGEGPRTLSKDLGSWSTTICQRLRTALPMAKESHTHSSSGLSDTDRAAFLGSRRVLSVQTPTRPLGAHGHSLRGQSWALPPCCLQDRVHLSRWLTEQEQSEVSAGLSELLFVWPWGATASRSHTVWGPLLTASREKENKILPTTQWAWL